MKYSPEEMNEKNASTFLRLIGCGTRYYAWSSIRRVIVPNLKKINPLIKNQLNATCAEIQRVRKPQKKIRRACIADDVGRLIKSSPDYLLTKSEEASLWLFSLCTGARAITALNVVLGDISFHNNQGDDPHLSFLLRVTKGSEHWNHRVSITRDESLAQ